MNINIILKCLAENKRLTVSVSRSNMILRMLEIAIIKNKKYNEKDEEEMGKHIGQEQLLLPFKFKKQRKKEINHG